MKPSLEALSTFVAIVEAGGLSPAARRLNIAKSVASKRLAELEEAAGTELIRRTTRHSQPTEAGTAFYARAKRILSELDAALEESACAEGTLRGPLRVTAPLTFTRLYLGRIFSEFAVAHPEVELTLDCDDRRVDIASGGYDLAIRIGRLADSALIARRLAAAPVLLVASPAYLEAHGAPAAIDELPGHRCIAYGNAPMAHQWRFEPASAADQSAVVTLTPRLTINNGEIISDAAIAGLGIASLPLFIVAGALKDGRLVRVLPGAVPEGGAIHAVWPSRPALSRKLRTLLDLVAARLPQHLAAAGALEA